MATQRGSNSSARSKTSSNKRRTSTTKRVSAAEKQRLEQQYKIRQEILFWVSLAVALLLFLSNFKITGDDGIQNSIIGSLGNVISSVEFGIFGILAYVMPVFVFVTVLFQSSNAGVLEAKLKTGAAITLFFVVDMLAALFAGESSWGKTIKDFYVSSSEGTGGGVIGTLICKIFHDMVGTVGCIVISIILIIICLVVLTEKSILNGMSKGSKKVYETAKDDATRRKEDARRRREEQQLLRIEREKELEKRKKEEIEAKKRVNKKISGVTVDTKLDQVEETDNIHELFIEPEKIDSMEQITIHGMVDEMENVDSLEEQIIRNTLEQVEKKEEHSYVAPVIEKPMTETPMTETPTMQAPLEGSVASNSKTVRQSETQRSNNNSDNQPVDIHADIEKQAQIVPKKKYVFPPVRLLKQPDTNKNKDSAKTLKETAYHLQDTLKTFGVNVTVTDISQGPAVTRYELQPEQGVKVSKIVNLADDIKLNLAATDIRIEAPIPGKAAVGIEVPNKENSMVSFRELIESNNYKQFDSNLAFAVGKDISGQTVVADIAKMPHMLIAGATGSGKSVCINTLIMSILYKASPDDVKLIMIDPKVVELSVYNGIPHLMIPVVTDPKKAAGALRWGVTEMTKRYQLFADLNVRDLKGYNKKVEQMDTNNGSVVLQKMPQVVIIVDELADLMMVAPGEVEESICRLAQLARAAGIHLIIATQRPSVDVITGLIKANMPSRVAFSVSSGIDSRTILDMNGAEKLLGKGDMLFYPQGYTKPARVQGAFVSDKEVSDVVDFIKNQCGEQDYAKDVEEIISCSVTPAGNGVFGADSASERDAYFYDAGTFLIEKEKASIGMLQRVFKIGFNRAARIMDQLAEAGVVGEEEGTKPRKVLMTQEQFEELCNQE